MITLNLLPDIKKEFISAQRTRNMVISISIIVSIVAGGLVALLAVAVYAGQSYIIQGQAKQITESHATLAKKAEIDKLLTVQSQLIALDSLKNDRPVYSRLFDYLQRLSPAAPYNVSIYSLKVDQATATLKLSGGAANFETINNFKNAIENATLTYSVNDAVLEKPFFSAITSYQAALTAGNAGATSASTTFSFDLSYSPEAFDSASKDVRLTVPKLTTSDGDKNAPKEIFAAPPVETKNGN